ncbi:menaquinone-specific isochorismate synthase [Propionibacterium cyclohexanicum]|uniref:Menaquinone-specific isochorismate synthase n=1 Tax=Propionibacterium cyclohexanicum TaxID=64702 RepID=A0A1H9T9G1_9ACTN|nr:chorismate-binding protein [Propionibacterium cyclohexanicum]SER93852.1 menaquinone-specific isochorismate synthase [Propionibacterium cyclohexanicum]
MIINPGSSRLHASTIAIPDPGPLTRYTDGSGAAFLRGNDGFVALGEIARLDGPTMAEANSWWSEFAATVENETEMPGRFGTGPLAYGAFVFDPERGHTKPVFVVPEVIIGRRDGVAWLTQVGYDRVSPVHPPVQPAPQPPMGLYFQDGEVTGARWLKLIAHVSERMQRGDAERVVLARDLRAIATSPISMAWVLRQWLINYNSCTCYLVDGVVGATPDVMLHRENGLVTSRVLAGGIERLGSIDNATRMATLLSSGERMHQHKLAIEASKESLSPFFTGMHIPEAPFVATFPDMLYLATDISGVAAPDNSSLELAAALHPVASVVGSPRGNARQIIAEDEKLERRHFTAPVGWIDAQGDGEWYVAQRTVHRMPNRTELTMYASSTISASTLPHNKLVSTEMKFSQMREILRGQ